MKVVIVGGGIIGLCSAYYVAQVGHEVTIIDKSNMEDGCSYGNAGMIVPSHVIPLAQPGMISQGVKWMFDSKSPFYVKPRFDGDLFRWGLQFYKHANKKHVERSMPSLKNLSLLSKELYRDLAAKQVEFNYDEKGLLMLYKSNAVGEEVIHEAEAAERLGLEVAYLSKDELPLLETGVQTEAIGGVHYKSDAHLYPQKFIKFLKEELKGLGVKFISNSTVSNFKMDKRTIKGVITSQNNEVLADQVVLCGGSWSAQLAKKLKVHIDLLPGKGYSFTLNDFKGPVIPSILCEGKVAVTPMGNDLRFGGTMEITHTNDTKININRLQGILNTIQDFYPNLSVVMPKEENVWFGFRPCTPTGLPIIRKETSVENLIIASGHAMMGLSLAPATGKLVEELISNKKLSVDNDMFT